MYQGPSKGATLWCSGHVFSLSRNQMARSTTERCPSLVRDTPAISTSANSNVETIPSEVHTSEAWTHLQRDQILRYDCNFKLSELHQNLDHFELVIRDCFPFTMRWLENVFFQAASMSLAQVNKSFNQMVLCILAGLSCGSLSSHGTREALQFRSPEVI
jgi:hypothetical protein